LILGASVSADHSAQSPGKVLSLRYTDPDQILVLARHGQAGADLLTRLFDSHFKDRSIGIGVDLFFWDSTHHNPELSLQAIATLESFVSKAKIPFILGEIPVLMPQYQPSVMVPNQTLHRLAAENSNFHILKLNKILNQILVSGSLTYRGRPYPLETLIPDGLHLVEPANHFLADEILEILVHRGDPTHSL